MATHLALGIFKKKRAKKNKMEEKPEDEIMKQSRIGIR